MGGRGEGGEVEGVRVMVKGGYNEGWDEGA